MKHILVLSIFIITGVTKAQDIIVTNDAETITAYNVDCSSKFVYYQLDNADNSVIHKIGIDNVIAIKKANGEKIVPGASVSEEIKENTQTESVPYIKDEGDYPFVDMSTYSGYLFEAGNCVFIPHNSEYDYERIGQNYIYNYVKENGIWKVVNKPEQAHFVLHFFTVTKGRDHSALRLERREYYQKNPMPTDCDIEEGITYNIGYSSTNEEIGRNHQLAVEFSVKLNERMQKIKDGKESQYFKSLFSIKPKKNK